jgi:formylglycine-generating enzyme required for sulfatase activity
MITTKQANFNASGTYDTNNLGKMTCVGNFPQNAWGLYDMHGNVWEWCADWYAKYRKGDQVDPAGPKRGSRRVMRGGSFVNPASNVRSAYRLSDVSSQSYSLISFHPARNCTS